MNTFLILLATSCTLVGQSYVIDENSSNDTVVGTLDVSRADTGDGPSYAITAGNTGYAFAIHAGTGRITV
ncbi:MAG: hypothetical protein MK134_12990, partial [Dehalococcoidia bacterium]|nr:hypothetical protein [Dehalococcoidia bacterium]